MSPSAMKSQVKTRFLLLSDTHSALPMHATATIHSKKHAYSEPLPEADVAIHTGDLTYNGRKEEHEAAVRLLKSITASLKIVIPGNHDLTLDTEYYAKKGHLWGPKPKYSDQELKYIRNLYTSAEARTNGIHYIEEGTHTFHLKNGALLTVYASAYTPEFCQWAFAYPRSKDRYNAQDAENLVPSFTTTSTTSQQIPQSDNDLSQQKLRSNPREPLESRNIDIILTHGPPLTILDKTLRQESVGCKHLLAATTRARPLLHCFGHIHEGWGAIRKTWPSISITTTATATDTVASTAAKHDEQQQDLGNFSAQETTTNFNTNTNWINDSSQGCADPKEEEEKIKTWKVSPESVVREHGCLVDATDIKRGEETVFVNAAIMDVNYTPSQAPFIVDLMLDRI